jgi:hypothetical protein
MTRLPLGPWIVIGNAYSRSQTAPPVAPARTGRGGTACRGARHVGGIERLSAERLARLAGLDAGAAPRAGMPGSPGLILRDSPPCRQSRASRPIRITPGAAARCQHERLGLEAPRQFAGLDACRPPPISPPSSTLRWWSPGSGSCCIGGMIDAPPALRRGPRYAESRSTKRPCGWQLYP